jgi:hypothetical protein
MSLINPKNFTAPLTNVMSLATIIVVGLLVLVYRWAGGELSFSNLKKIPGATYIADGDQTEKSTGYEQPLKQASKSESKSGSAEELLDGLLEEEQEVAPDWGNRKSPLDDISKQLGGE